MTVDPLEKSIVVSSRIREEYENGREYYALHGRPLAQPHNRLATPSVENLRYSRGVRFPGLSLLRQNGLRLDRFVDFTTVQETLYSVRSRTLQRASGSPVPRWNPKEELEKAGLIPY